ncbi:MAG: hypothetical protein HQK49_21700 [Oligoflexia bacterium]|nr:hypothetical protein [Oligoflexia bacterium]
MKMKSILFSFIVATNAFIALGITASFADCNFFIKAAMQIKWDKNKWLGNATNDFTPLLKEEGCFRRYQHGSIYATAAGGAWEIHGSIRDKWGSLGLENSFLGYPTSDETTTPDGIGRFNHFQGGSIYWHPCIGAFEVHGLIRQKWSQMGYEKSKLGYPKSDELKTSDLQGRYSKFQHGAIYYHPQHGTHPILGVIYYQWADQGFEKGSLGYPTSDPVCNSANECSQQFENGTLDMYNIKKVGVDLRKEISRRGIGTQAQGSRPTCSVFAMTALLEFAYTEMCGSQYANLSEEYLNHMANVATGRTDDGDYFSYIASGYDKYGIVVETLLPYKSTYNYSSTSIPQTTINQGLWMIQKGMKFSGKFIKANDGTQGMSTEQYLTVLNYLNSGVPVAIGRSHSQVIVGYVAPKPYISQGYFIIKDSGLAGYTQETTDSVRTTVNDVYVYDIK